MDTWYHAPFPAEYEGYHELWFCEFTLRFFRTEKGWLRHHARNKQRHPPGDEIYRKGNISMFEIDGSKQKLWCQHLCYVAKLFLDHKTLFYDVDVFFFCAYLTCTPALSLAFMSCVCSFARLLTDALRIAWGCRCDV